MDILVIPVVAAYVAVIAGVVDTIKARFGLSGTTLQVISWGLGIGVLAYLKAAGQVDVEWAWVIPYGISMALGTGAIYKAGKALTSK